MADWFSFVQSDKPKGADFPASASETDNPPTKATPSRARVDPSAGGCKCGKQATGKQAGPSGPPVEMRYGQTIDTDARLSALRRREFHFLTKVIPRARTCWVAAQDWVARTREPAIFLPVLLIVLLHVGTAVGCSVVDDDDICAGGPGSAFDDNAFSEYAPPVINLLATLFLSFYANVCMGRYQVTLTLTLA